MFLHVEFVRCYDVIITSLLINIIEFALLLETPTAMTIIIARCQHLEMRESAHEKAGTWS